MTPQWIAKMNGCNGCRGTGQQNRDGFAFGDEYNTMERNRCLVKDIAPDFVPWAFVHKGEWHEGERMGWFGFSGADENGQRDTEDQWRQRWGEARGALADEWAVLVDCHV